MFRNYFRIAYRNLMKQKIFSFINIFGLTAGLTCFLLIALYLVDELTFDAFHQDADHIYRVVESKTSEGGVTSKVAAVGHKISVTAKQELPEVANATIIAGGSRMNVKNEENSQAFYEDFIYADENFFKVFDFQFLSGNRNVLGDPYSVVLTDETARKIFGHTDVLGKKILTEIDSLPTRIGAVIHIPANSHIQFNMLFSELRNMTRPQYARYITSDWNSNNFVTYIALKNKTPEQTAAKIDQLVNAGRPQDRKGNSKFTLQPIRDIHFHSAGMEAGEGSGNLMHAYVFGLVALFVLCIACINYMNLTTARFAGRSKEIAVRKVAGAERKHLVVQFLCEAVLVTGIALVLALICVNILLPHFNAFTEKQLNLGLHTDSRIWIGVFLVTLVAALIAGTYPAFFQARLKPYLLLKQKLAVAKGHLSLRQSLVIVQFSLSIIMIIATITVFRQLRYVSTRDMGFNKEQLVVIDINSGSVRRSANTIQAEYQKFAAVKNVCITSRVPGEWKSIPKVLTRPAQQNNPTPLSMAYIAANDQFLPTYNIKLLQGRNFSPAAIADSDAVILNATAAKQLGITQASNQLIDIPSIDFNGNVENLDAPIRVRVIGIVNDFNFRSLREAISPMMIGHLSNPIHTSDYFTARIASSQVPETLKQMETILQSIDASHLFEYNFLDKQWERFYREDQKRQVIFFAVALMTILIACLGLFGLAAYAAEQRIKEIGIRKVLGASTGGIVTMLSKDFLRLVIIATLIAIPVSWWIMHQWLQDFAYRTTLAWWVFAMAGCMDLLIAVVTISSQAIRAALANPVKSLRSE